MEINNLDKQLIPYLEPVIKQTLDMVEEILKENNSSWEEGKNLLFQLEKEFGEYNHMLSPQIQGRILEINDRLSSSIDVSDEETSIEDII